MAEPQETYLAHLATLGIDATQIVTDHKGTVASSARGDARPRATLRLPRLLLGTDDELGEADLELGDPLGKGGMGVVWSATQVALRRRVAVKRLRDERVGPEAEAQLLREALVTGALEHPNIVPVHTLGRDDDGRPLLVMKRIEGTPWSALLRPLYTEGGPAEASEIERHLGILMQVCQALDFAHAQGVVHRDIKPENVMVGSFGEVYVLDWGIAVSTRGGDHGLPPMEAGTLMGTPAYMAPEMAAAGPVDSRTDVYLLGATLHELITGRPRHQGDGVFATLTLAFESKPVEYPEHVPTELAAICNRATHFEPARRYASAQALRDAVAEFLRHGSSRELSKEGWQRLELLEDMLGSDARRVTADAIEIHTLATEGRFAFERAWQQWPGNTEARKGLQRLLARMIRWELSNGNVRAAAGLLGALPEPNPVLEREVEQARRAQLERQREIAKLEKLRDDGDINAFSAARRHLGHLKREEDLRDRTFDAYRGRRGAPRATRATDLLAPLSTGGPKTAPREPGLRASVGSRLGRVPCSARADELAGSRARTARAYPSRPSRGSRGSRSFGLHAAPKRSSSWPSIVGRGRGGGRGPRPAWASALLISSRVVASLTRRMRPAHCGHTVTSTANTRASSHAHGCRDARSLVDAGSPSTSLALAASKPSPELHRLARRARGSPRHDLGASLRMRREHAVIAQHVKPRRRDEGHEARHEIERLEHDGVRAVPPRPLEAIAQPPIAVLLEPLLRERRPGDVPAEPLEPLAIAPVDRRARVHVHAADVGERLARREHLADRTHELARRLARSLAEELPVGRARIVERRERGLLLGEHAGRVVVTLERATVPREHTSEPLVHPRGDLHHLLVRGVGQALELQRTALPPHVHAIERERVEVQVQPQRRVAALHERDRTDLRRAHRAQPERSLGPPP